eukprot:m.124226 g.124226  ORF g.124226 m.124226 type:complete len:127 (-) comp14644_c0_seq1:2116-2496(-)
MPQINSKLSLGAIVTALAKNLRPIDPIKAKYPNTYKNERVDNLLVRGQGVRTHKNKETQVLLLRHEDFEGVDLWVLPASVRFKSAGQLPYYVWGSTGPSAAGKIRFPCVFVVNSFGALSSVPSVSL